MSQLLEEIESLRGSMKTLNDFFFDHPELGNEEFLAHGKLTDLLDKRNEFPVNSYERKENGIVEFTFITALMRW